MTNPFETFAPAQHAAPVHEDFPEFPEFEAEIPAITRQGNGGGSTGPRMPNDPKVAACITFLQSAVPGKSAKVIGEVGEETDKLCSKISLSARRWNIKVTRRTVSHQGKNVVAIWRSPDPVK